DPVRRGVRSGSEAMTANAAWPALPGAARKAMRIAAACVILSAALGGAGIVDARAQGVTETFAPAAEQRIKLGLNKSIVLDLPSAAYDFLVANPGVADAVTRTARRIYLFGKAVGETNIFVFGPNGEQIASLDLVIERDVAGLEHHIRRFIPTSDVKVELIND